jgi:hypothetical protein
MNLTVGPLPPAVYWRRRAIVLGGLLLVILLMVYACGGSGTSNASNQQSPPPVAAASPSDLLTPSVSPSVLVTATSSGTLVPAVSDSPSAPASPSPSIAAAGSTCTDAQIQVTPVISPTSSTRLVYGGTFDLKLKIRNISSVTCKRDVGGVPEELEISQGTTKIWSSDDCGTGGKPHDVRTFAPGIQIYAEVKWSSYDVTTSSCKKAAHPAKVGSYTLTGRVGTKKASAKFKIEN